MIFMGIVGLLPMLAFVTDRQAAFAAKGIRRWQASPARASAAHGRPPKRVSSPVGAAGKTPSAALTGLEDVNSCPTVGCACRFRGCAHPRLIPFAATPLNCRCLCQYGHCRHRHNWKRRTASRSDNLFNHLPIWGTERIIKQDN